MEPYSLFLPKKILKLVHFMIKEENIDKSVAITNLIYIGAENYIIDLCKKERISLSRASELLGIDTLDIMKIAKERGIQIDAAGIEKSKDVTELKS
jgi:predicted HTH domain antitoxin